MVQGQRPNWIVNMGAEVGRLILGLRDIGWRDIGGPVWVPAWTSAWQKRITSS